MRLLADPETQAELRQRLHDLGYAPDPRFAGFNTGRPDRATFTVLTRKGLRAVAKLGPPEVGEQTFSNMQEVWRSSFGQNREPPGLPQPLDYLPEVGALITEFLPGRPLAEAGVVDERSLQCTLGLLAALHGSDAAPVRRRSWRGILRSIKRKAEMISTLAPRYAGDVCAVFDALASTPVKDSELVPSHGDFSPRNVLVGPGRMVLIDWERFQYADPARDVAYFGISSWKSDLRRGQEPDRALLKHAVRVYKSFRPQAKIEKQLRFHVAAGLIRMACSLVELWPQEAYLVPTLARTALRELQE